MVGPAPLGRSQTTSRAEPCSAGGVASKSPKPGLRRFLKLGTARLVPMSGHRQTDDGARRAVANAV